VVIGLKRTCGSGVDKIVYGIEIATANGNESEDWRLESHGIRLCNGLASYSKSIVILLSHTLGKQNHSLQVMLYFEILVKVKAKFLSNDG